MQVYVALITFFYIMMEHHRQIDDMNKQNIYPLTLIAIPLLKFAQAFLSKI